MWWPTQARPPLATQKVLFSSAPQASTGGASRERQVDARAARSRASAAADRRRRAGRGRARAAPSRRSASGSARSWSRKRSAIAGQPLERVVVAVGDRLVGDVAAGHHERRPDVGAAAGGEAASRGASRRGRVSAGRPPSATGALAGAGERSRSAARGSPAAPASAAVSSTSARAASRSGRHQRERLVLAVLSRAQRRPPRRSSSARQARWKPPRPLTATIRPSPSAAAAAATASAGRGRRRRRSPAAVDAG